MSSETVEVNSNTAANEKKVRAEDKQASGSTSDPPPYKPNPAESAALEKFWSRQKEKTAPRLKIAFTGDRTTFQYDHPHPGLGAALFEQSLGTADDDFASGLISQLSRLAHSANGKPSEELLNFLFSVVRGVNPRDEIEALIATQMAAIHMAIMKAMEQFDLAIMPPSREIAERMIGRLVRTFASLVVALKRYRGGSSK